MPTCRHTAAAAASRWRHRAKLWDFERKPGAPLARPPKRAPLPTPYLDKRRANRDRGSGILSIWIADPCAKTGSAARVQGGEVSTDRSGVGVGANILFANPRVGLRHPVADGNLRLPR